ncbi:hypothetical protein ACSDR0_20170 [Streptosporangium sp. G11]
MSAARELAPRGDGEVLVLDEESTAGGVPGTVTIPVTGSGT